MWMKALGLSALAAGALLTAGCGESAPSADGTQAGAQGTRSVTHAQGTTQVPQSPSRVAVFDLSALDTLNALGVEVAGVAGDIFPPYLSQYAEDRYAKLGTLFEPDLEAVNALRPDLAITGGRSSPRYPQLASMVTTIDMRVDDNAPMANAIANTRMLAQSSARLRRRKSGSSGSSNPSNSSVRAPRLAAAG
jgi:iron complex transport system substrate-binding protein